MTARGDRTSHRLQVAVGALAAPLALTAGGPPPSAAIAVTRVGAEPTAVVLACEDQPQLALRVYTGEDVRSDVAGKVQGYTVTGGAQALRPVLVPLTSGSADWAVTGDAAPLDPAAETAIDVEDGTDRWLGASVYTTLADLPDSPRVMVPDHSRPVTLHDFTAAPLDIC